VISIQRASKCVRFGACLVLNDSRSWHFTPCSSLSLKSMMRTILLDPAEVTKVVL